MSIQGPSSIQGAQGVRGPFSSNRTSSSRPAQSTSGAADQLDISAAGEAAAQAAENDIRSDLVTRVRNEIAAGTYETPEKLDAALDGLLNELG